MTSPDTAGEDLLQFSIAFGGARHALAMTVTSTVGDLKLDIQELLGVRASGQKLIGLKATDDETPLSALPLKRPVQQIVLMGTRDADLEAAEAAREAAAAARAAAGTGGAGEDGDEDEEPADTDAVPVHLNPVYDALIDRRVASFKPHVEAGFRPGSRTLVLDIDYTLIDHRSTVSAPAHMARPFLHHFLATAYSAGYDIVIWSATSLSWALLKMRSLGVTSHSAYKIAGFMHAHAMITVEHPSYGRVEVKPLPVLWRMAPEHSRRETTIMLDDLRRNFLCNPEVGLRIRACRNLPATRESDRELLHLSCYLALIARMDSFVGLSHSRWRSLLRKHGYDTETAGEAKAMSFLSSLPPLPPLSPTSAAAAAAEAAAGGSAGASAGDASGGSGGAASGGAGAGASGGAGAGSSGGGSLP